MPESNKYLDFYIKSSLHVGLAVFALVLLKINQLNSYAFFVFFGTIVGYNFLKYSKWLKFNKILDKKFKVIVCITLASAVGCILLFFLQKQSVQLHLVFALLFVVLYPSVRKIGWLKPFFVAFVVTYITAYIPLKSDEKVILVCLQQFFILSSVIIPFEIFDSTTDSAALKTLPHLFGIQKTKYIGYVLIGLFCVISHYLLECVFSSFMYAISSLGAIYLSSVKRSWYYTSFWVESLPIFWWLISIVFQ